MADILSEFSIHVGTAVALGPGPAASTWHRREADWREREIRDFIAALAAEVRLYRQTATDPERIAIADALLAAHPKLTNPALTQSERQP